MKNNNKINEDILAYTVTDAYNDNYTVTMYKNGKEEKSDIVAYYEIEGYELALNSFGYKKGITNKEYNEIKEEIKSLQERLDFYDKNGMIINVKEK